MRAKSGRECQRFGRVFVFGMLSFLASSFVELKAELIPAVENPISVTLREMIENKGSFFDRLLSWSELRSVNVTLGNLADGPISDVAQSHEELFNERSGFSLIAGWFSGGASNSLESSSSTSNAPPVSLAIPPRRSSLTDSVLVLDWRGREYIHIPEAPSSGLFRPPRQSCSIQRSHRFKLNEGFFPDALCSWHTVDA